MGAPVEEAPAPTGDCVSTASSSKRSLASCVPGHQPLRRLYELTQRLYNFAQILD